MISSKKNTETYDKIDKNIKSHITAVTWRKVEDSAPNITYISHMYGHMLYDNYMTIKCIANRVGIANTGK